MLKVKKMSAVALTLSLLTGCFGGLAVSASDNVNVIQTYDSKVGFKAASAAKKQGADHWYYREYSAGKSTELKYNSGKNGNAWGWYSDDYSGSVREDAMNASPTFDTEMTFKSDFKGLIRIKSSIVQMAWTNYIGDGVIASISKNSKELWTAEVLGGTPVETELTVSVKKGDEINFRVNCNAYNAYDAFAWWPIIERIEGEYVSDDSFTYYQFDGMEKTQLTVDESFNDGEGGYLSSEYYTNGSGFLTDSKIMAGQKYSLIKSLELPGFGRYRVYGYLNTSDTKGGGNIVTILKNDEIVWKQLFVEGEDGRFDVRMLADKGDVIDIMVSANEFVGYNAADWQCEITGPYMPAISVCDSTSIGGMGGATDGEVTNLGSIATSGSDLIDVYSIKYDKKYPMTWDSSSKTWKSSITGDGGYISETKTMPGYYSETVMEQTIDKNGTIRLSGKFGVSANSDGVLAKIYIIKKDSGKQSLLWSSRVGGERSVRWDEKYDTCYFNYNVDAVANVEVGDIIKYVFNHWRIINNDNTDINTVEFRYITAPVLSETTKWKAENSIIVDTVAQKIYKDATEQNVTVKLEDETFYILKSDAAKLGFDTSGLSGDYVSVREVAENAQKAVNWVGDRYIMIYDGIPVMFGYAENCEIKAVLEKGGSLFE